MRASLRTQIVAWSFVPTLLILGAVAVFTFYSYRQVTETLVRERDQEPTQLFAAQMGTEISAFGAALAAVGATPDVLSFAPAAQEAALRWSMGKLRDFDGGVLILDAQGRVTAADPRRREAIGQDWSTRGYFQPLAGGLAGALVTSDIVPDGPGGSPVVALAVPLRSHNRFAGAIVGLFRAEFSATSAFYRRLYRAGGHGGARLYLVDSQGRTIVDPDPSRIGQDLSGHPAVQSVLAHQSGTVRTPAAIASFAPVPGTSWGVVEEESWGSLARVTQGYERILLLLLVLGLAVPALIVAVGLRRITGPIAELTAAAQKMADGNLGQVIRAPASAELAALAAAFNRMSVQLQDSYAGLERKVAGRTRELATLNAVANVVSRSLDLQQILAAALDKASAALEMPAGGAFRLQGQMLALVAGRGLAATPEGIPLAELGPLSAARALAIADLPPGPLQAWLEAEGWQTAVSIPLTAKEAALGAMLLGSPRPRAIAADELALLTAIGQQVGLAVENGRLYEQAEQAAAAAERSRLARELHDSVTQTLFAANLIAGVAPTLWEQDPAEGRQQLVELSRLTQGALAEMRTLLLELRPETLAQAALPEVLKQLCDGLSARSRVPIVYSGAEQVALPPPVRVALYRTAQEALNNMARHAAATEAWVNLRTLPDAAGAAAGVELQIRDNGRGFEPGAVPAGHLGLRIMQERAEAVGAELQIKSRPGEGTCIIVRWQGG